MRGLGREGDAFLALVQRFRVLEEIGDVNGRADITEKISLPVIAWCSVNAHPTKLAIVPSQAVLNDKWFARVESGVVTLHRVIEVILMDNIRPAVAEFLRCAPGKVKPRFVKKYGALIRTGHPHEDRRSIRGVLKALLAFGQGALGAPTSDPTNNQAGNKHRFDDADGNATYD
jgi:hypothetical protein